MKVKDMTVWDSIDRPIRPLVYELNRIGLQTVWSCCSFNYKGEEEAKSHNTVPFVTFADPKAEALSAFFSLARACHSSGWTFHKIYYDQWRVFVPSFEHGSEGWVAGKDQDVALHAYEDPLLKILALTGAIEKFPGLEEFEVKDGNKRQIEVYPSVKDEWQIETQESKFFKVPVDEEITNEN